MELQIKICGMKYPENIGQVSKLLPDYMGFIFYPESSRYTGDVLDMQVLRKLPASICKVGVFVNPSKVEVMKCLSLYKLDLIQLHGDESPGFCDDLRPYVPVMKAFRIDENFNFTATAEYQGICRQFLFDTRTSRYGGSGKSFDWALLEKYKGKTPFLLSGGIGLLQAKAVPDMKSRISLLQGVDVNSHFETEPGMKDVTKLKKLTHYLRVKIK
jgi:phosphoribosylanthranilate isomerase